MCLLRAIRRILCCGQDEEEEHRYYSIRPPILPSRSNSLHRSRTEVYYPQQHQQISDDALRALLRPGPLMDSRENSKLPTVNRHRDGNETIFPPTGSSNKSTPISPFFNLPPPSHFSPVSTPSTPALSSKTSFTPVSSSNNTIPVVRVSIGPTKLQITKDSATCSPDKPSATSLLPPSSAPAPSSKNCTSPSPQSVASSSKKTSSATFSTSTSSIPDDPSRICQPKFQVPSDPTTWKTEKTLSPSPTLPNKVSVSRAPPLNPSPSPISVAKSSLYGDGGRVWKKKNLPSTESYRETQQDIFSLSQTSVEVPTPDSSSSVSSPSSESPSPRQISKRRVLPKYQIPKYLVEMIKKDMVPPILKCPLSPSTYGDYFATLLSAEDFYLEKWSEFLLKDVTLELRPRTSSTYSLATNMKGRNTKLAPKDFVAFKIDEVPEKRPYLLSRDFVFLQPPDNATAEPFKGILFRVVKSVLLVEFSNDFHSQHSPTKTYNVSFSFNRVCLKRAHQAISIATDPSIQSILFPDQSFFSPQPNSFHFHGKVLEVQDPVKKIVNHKGPIPYLIQGDLSVVKGKPIHGHGETYHEEIRLTSTGTVIVEAILNIYRANPRCRILVCSPTNITSDVLLRSLQKRTPGASLFRANAAFRDYNLVPDDIFPASLYEEEEECFACPPLAELLNFNVITCTFISSFRLYSAGIDSNHFSHIFLVDACLAIEPEAIVPLANLAGKNTAVVVTGCASKSPGWVRSEIGRRYGLKVSYFSRLLGCEPYRSGDAMFIAKIHTETTR